jgi:uncharacterized protein
MFIDLTQLEQDRLPFEYQYPIGKLDLQDPGLALKLPCQVVMNLERVNKREVRVRGTVTAGIQVFCDRCLVPFTVAIDSAFDLIYLPLNNLSETDELVLERRELDFSFYRDERIDLDELVREQIQLSLPMVNLCREDCKGLCSQCGQDLNTSPCRCSNDYVDPRWSALLELKKKIN